MALRGGSAKIRESGGNVGLWWVREQGIEESGNSCVRRLKRSFLYIRLNEASMIRCLLLILCIIPCRIRLCLGSDGRCGRAGPEALLRE